MFTGEFEDSSKETSENKLRMTNNLKQEIIRASKLTTPKETIDPALPLSIGGIGMNVSFINLCLFSLQVNVSHGGDAPSIEVNDNLQDKVEEEN